MTATLEMPHVSDCTATTCAYNHDGCHAYAINVTSAASCGTFLSLNHKGGLDVIAQVGACQREDCVHNGDLECHAPSIRVGSGAADADCLSYQARVAATS